MVQLISWIKTVAGWCSWTSEDESQATHSARPPVWYLNRATKRLEKAQPVWYLNHTTKRLVKAQQRITEVKLRHSQCIYLAEKLETAIEDIRKFLDRSSSPDHKAECLETLKLLHRLATEVERFVQECCEDKAWIQAALTSASVPARVTSLGRDLKLCTELLRNSDKLGAAWLTFTNLEGPWEAEREESEMASYDAVTLLRLLESLTLSSESRITDMSQLATILRKRLTEIQVPSTAGSSLLSNLEVWKVDRGNFERLKMVGRGSSATVFKATWLGAVEVAEKVFDRNSESTFVMMQVALSAEFSHPNVVTFFGYSTDESFTSLIMEWMDGDLRTLMQQRMQEDQTRMSPFSIWEACDLMLQVAEGVHYMHQNGVVHRDLNSENVLFRRSKEDGIDYVSAKVSHFETSYYTGRSTCSDPTWDIGRRKRMAPEYIHYAAGISRYAARYAAGTSQYSENGLKHPFKSDVYSFGLVCWEILTGETPFLDIPNPQEMRRVLDGKRPPMPVQCPMHLKSLIQLCWDADPNTRPSFTEICEELRYIKCSLLLEPLDEVQTDEDQIPDQPTPNLPREVSKLKRDYSTLEVVRPLGKGGLDTVTVYLSTWRRPEGVPEDVAQKTFIGSHDDCFVNELSILAALEHSNVVRLLGYATDRRSCCIVMERMDGDLQDLMRQRRWEGYTTTGPFSKDEAVHVILQIAQGMDYVHRKNVVHRDIKSCNILFRNAGKRGQLVVKVADFGLSVRMDSRRSKDSGVGTVRWMAPEVMVLEDDENGMHADTSDYDPFKCDVYSFGMVCYEILAGRVPFHNIHNLKVVKKKVLGGERPALPTWTPSNLKALVENCWQKGAERRPSFGDIIKELTQISP